MKKASLIIFFVGWLIWGYANFSHTDHYELFWLIGWGLQGFGLALESFLRFKDKRKASKSPSLSNH